MKKIGLIGYGYWGPNLARNIEGSSQFELSAILEINPDRRRTACSKHPSTEIVASLDELYKLSLDAVAIATPVSTHYALVKKSLLEGLHVLVEKPLTGSVVEAEELVALAKEKDLALMVDHTFLYTSAVQKIKSLIDAGDIGNLLYYEADRENLGLFQKDVNAMWDLSVHDISILSYIFHETPKKVTAIGSRSLENSPESTTYLSLAFDGFKVASIRANWLSPVKVRRIVIGGSKKIIIYDELNTIEKIKIYDKGVNPLPTDSLDEKHNQAITYRHGDVYSPNLDDIEALSNMIEKFAQEMSGPRTREGSGETGLSIVKILSAAQKSMDRSGEPVEV